MVNVERVPWLHAILLNAKLKVIETIVCIELVPIITRTHVRTFTVGAAVVTMTVVAVALVNVWNIITYILSKMCKKQE